MVEFCQTCVAETDLHMYLALLQERTWHFIELFILQQTDKSNHYLKHFFKMEILVALEMKTEIRNY